MNYNILILIPKLDLTGPARGAVALRNGLRNLGVSVELIPLKDSGLGDCDSNKLLINEKRFFAKAKKLRKHLACNIYERQPPIIISFCLQADILAYIAGSRKRILSSVRGNLYENYSDDYGKLGYLLALSHYLLLKCFPVITALNSKMQQDLRRYNQCVEVIPNFIDELNISNMRDKPSGSFKFVFVGSLSRRKAVIELIHAFISFNKIHTDTELHIIGNGPLRGEVKKLIVHYDASNIIKEHGFISDPLPIVKKCDVFVLPSKSEGISRAAMEALYLGKRCIMQNVDGNAELILSTKQGILIDNLNKLDEALGVVYRSGREKDIQRLPKNFRQKSCSEKFIDIFEKHFDTRN